MRTQAESDWASYDSIADQYAQFQAPRLKQPVADLLDLIRLAPRARILDVGAGTGACAQAAGSVVGTKAFIVGLDISLQMLRTARELSPSARYVASDARRLPFKHECFDSALSCFALSHVSDYNAVLAEMWRVLRRGGHIGLTTFRWATDEATNLLRFAAERFVNRSALDASYKLAMPSSRVLSNPAVVLQALEAVGAVDIRVDERDYELHVGLDDYLASREVTATGRFLRHILDQSSWDSWRRLVGEMLQQRFGDTVIEHRGVILGVGLKLRE